MPFVASERSETRSRAVALLVIVLRTCYAVLRLALPLKFEEVKLILNIKEKCELILCSDKDQLDSF